MLLREHGYACNVGRLYYAGSKTLVDVPIDDALVQQTRGAIDGARTTKERTAIPPPLVDSPKCARCSLYAICLPDEINVLRGAHRSGAIRPFGAPADDRGPVYVLEPGARADLNAEVLEVRTDAGVAASVPLIEVGSLSLFGNTHVSSQTILTLLTRDVPVFY